VIGAAKDFSHSDATARPPRKYELQEFLGGGMSHVYKAFDTVIGRTVAVKILVEPASQDPEARDRFLAEAQTAAKVTTKTSSASTISVPTTRWACSW